MKAFEGHIPDKLPGIPTSIFAVMTQLATRHQAVNMAQGFPDFPVSPELIGLVDKYMKEGRNQYAPMPGVPELRRAIASKVMAAYEVAYDWESEITVTAGATQAIFTAITAFVRDGDQVIVLEPAYDSYAPAVRLCGGTVRFVRMQHPAYTIDWDEVQRNVTRDTRMIIVNSPHNPSGAVFTMEDMLRLQRIVAGTDILVISDEVYEHLIYDGLAHESACQYPELAKRALIMGSFGKTFHATGWKTGYCLAPEELMHRFRMVHQFVVFCSNTAVQYAIAEFLEDERNYLGLPDFYQAKRDLFLDLLKDSRFRASPASGTYFQLLDYSAISDLPEEEFARWLTTEHGIAAIPCSAFYQRAVDNGVLRFCFAKTEETLRKAASILCRI
ncbi:MAG TPA: methionine aminotransferase [Bacteroidales bacterium]|nr:methionine aminotransferase [Bacteroidales bacterium]